MRRAIGRWILLSDFLAIDLCLIMIESGGIVLYFAAFSANNFLIALLFLTTFRSAIQNYHLDQITCVD